MRKSGVGSSFLPEKTNRHRISFSKRRTDTGFHSNCSENPARNWPGGAIIPPDPHEAPGVHCLRGGVLPWCRTQFQGGNPMSGHHSCPKRRTDIAPRSSGKKDSRKLETFQMEPCG